jgi:hypothetical protein
LALTGTLREFGLVDLLSLVRVTRKSGALSIDSQAESLDLFVRDGRLVRFTSSPTHHDLGQILLHARKVTQDQIDAIPADIRSSEKAVAVAVMEATGLSRADLLAIVSAEASEAIGRALMWNDGQFAFAPDIEVGEDDVTFDLDLIQLIDHMRSRQDQWRVLRSVLPHLHYRLRFAPGRRLRPEPVVLSPVEWGVITQIGGSATLDYSPAPQS